MKPGASSNIIEMTGVAVGALHDPDTVVVEDVNWTVTAGDFWAVGGRTGSGKSDFLMLAAGLLTPPRGQCRIFGDALPIFEEARLAQRLRLGFVFDGGHLFNNLTIAENVALPLQYHSTAPPAEIAARVEQLLAATELTSWTNSTPGTMGRNWQKRVGLARALALAPEVLLLDNPLGGADARHAAWWLEFLGQLATGHELLPGKRAVTLVVTADDLHPWQHRARQFAVLREGRLEVLAKEKLAAETPNG